MKLEEQNKVNKVSREIYSIYLPCYNLFYHHTFCSFSYYLTLFGILFMFLLFQERMSRRMSTSFLQNLLIKQHATTPVTTSVTTSVTTTPGSSPSSPATAPANNSTQSPLAGITAASAVASGIGEDGSQQQQSRSPAGSNPDLYTASSSTAGSPMSPLLSLHVQDQCHCAAQLLGYVHSLVVSRSAI